MSEEDYVVECNVCKAQYKNHAGSTPCCGSIAFVVEDEELNGSIRVWTKTTNSEAGK